MTAPSVQKSLVQVLDGQRRMPPPVWLMRQAGRYLPEYREVRERAGGFLDLCLNPKLAAEVTLQPVRRFGLDAAILFSDILIVPYALGRSVRFTVGEGPQLDPLDEPMKLSMLATELDQAKIAPIYETVRQVRSQLRPDVALIGFCGAPWTVATYMIAGHGTPDQAPARTFAYRHSDEFQRLVDILVDASVEYLAGQFDAGVDVVQIFDTWAGVLPPEQFVRWCVAPTQEIVARLRQRVPDARIIGFPRGAGMSAYGYAQTTGVNAIGLDWTMDLGFVQEMLQSHLAVQGNLDPLLLRAGGAALDRGVDTIMTALAGGPFIFNLGHGILPDTPIAHVEQMLRRVRG